MKKLFVLLFALSVGTALSGCGSDEGSNLMEDASQTDIEAYEASMAEEEGAMDADFEEGVE